jgi:LEA14-like dessication related protein
MTARPALLLALVPLLLLSGCAAVQQALQPPTARFQTARFQAVDFEKLSVDLHIGLTNNNPLGAQLSGYSTHFTVDGLTLLDGTVNQPLDLSPGTETTLIVPISVRWAELAGKLGELGSGPLPAKLPWRARGALKVATPLGELSVPYDFDGELPVIAPPLIVPAGIRMVEVTPLQLSLAVDFEVHNLTARAMGLTAARQQLTVDGSSIADGRLLGGEPVPAHGKALRTVGITLSMYNVAGSLMQAVLNRGAVRVGLQGTLDVDTGVGVVPLRFDVSEGLSIRRRAGSTASVEDGAQRPARLFQGQASGPARVGAHRGLGAQPRPAQGERPQG